MMLHKALIRSLMFVFFVGFLSYIEWKSPLGNRQASIPDVIHNSSHEKCELFSMGHKFNICYVENTDKNSSNPYEPAIEIATEGRHNAWLQVVRVDAADPKWKNYLDAADPHGPWAEVYPFHTLEQKLYDAPLWLYKLYFKEFTFWKAHSYAVNVDHEKKTIECVGGIEWGYGFKSPFSLWPYMILPAALGEQDWKTDWNFFKNYLSGYKHILMEQNAL